MHPREKGQLNNTRLVRLLRMIEDFRNGMAASTGELANKYEQCRRQMNRDLNVIQEVHKPLYYEVDGHRHVWRLVEESRVAA